MQAKRKSCSPFPGGLFLVRRYQGLKAGVPVQPLQIGIGGGLGSQFRIEGNGLCQGVEGFLLQSGGQADHRHVVENLGVLRRQGKRTVHVRKGFVRLVKREECPSLIPCVVHLRIVQKPAQLLERIGMVIDPDIDRPVVVPAVAGLDKGFRM